MGRSILKSPQDPARIDSWLKKSKQDNNVGDALRFLCEQNWINLYKIFEIVKDDVDDLREHN